MEPALQLYTVTEAEDVLVMDVVVGVTLVYDMKMKFYDENVKV